MPLSILPPPLSFHDCIANGKIDVNRWFTLRRKRRLANSSLGNGARGTGADIVPGTGDVIAEIVPVEVVNTIEEQ